MYFMDYQGQDIRGVISNKVYDALQHPSAYPLEQVVVLFWLRDPEAAKTAILSRTC